MSSIRRALGRIREGGWRVVALATVPVVALGIGPPLIESGNGSSPTPGSGPAGKSGGPSAVVRHDALPGGKTPAQVRAFWTPRRMREAKPVPLGRPPLPASLPPSGEVQAHEGQPSFVPPDVPGGGVQKLQQGLVQAGNQQVSPQSQENFPYERYEIPETTTYPARVHGKVFFTAGGYWWVCSATVVTTSGLSAVFTAGHCVYSRKDGWASNWLFVPGYRDENEPFGEYAAEELVSLNGWVYSENFSYDIGVALLSWPVEGDVGARGIAWNQPRQQKFTSWGYPAANPFDGERLFVCVSNYWLSDPYPPPTGPAPMGIGCDMTGGSSGGGWTISDQFVNSVNSFKYPAWDAEMMFGPYFGEGAENLYNSVCCGPTPQRSLAVNRTGSGSGTLTSSPPGINCGPACSAQFNYGESVTLTAAAAVGSNFTGWSGCESPSGSTCAVKMNADKTVSASFNTVPRTLSVGLAGSGSGRVTSSPPGIDCSPTCSAQFNHGQLVTLSATAATGSNFAGWTGACSGTGPCTLNMDGDKGVTATFNLSGGGGEEGGGGPGGGGQSTSPPEATITGAVINAAKHRAKFRFTASGGTGALSFLCKLDRRAFSPCTSPKTYRRLKPGKHTFKVKAMDSRGQVDSTPAVRKFNLRTQR